jgi:hypothetical protein
MVTKKSVAMQDSPFTLRILASTDHSQAATAWRTMHSAVGDDLLPFAVATGPNRGWSTSEMWCTTSTSSPNVVAVPAEPRP